MINANICGRLRCSKKVEKHWRRVWTLDVNDTRKRPITNLMWHFCLWLNHTVQTHKVHESNYTQ